MMGIGPHATTAQPQATALMATNATSGHAMPP